MLQMRLNSRRRGGLIRSFRPAHHPYVYSSRTLPIPLPKSRNHDLMSSQLIASHRENAEVYTDEELCKQKTKDLLARMSLPTGLIPFDDVTEVGYDESTGFVWLNRRKRNEHWFRLIRRKVAYDTAVTAFVEERRLKKLTGVKSKELLLWVTISDISIADPSSGKIAFSTPAGLSRSFPIAAFEDEEDKKQTDGERR